MVRVIARVNTGSHKIMDFAEKYWKIAGMQHNLQDLSCLLTIFYEPL